LTAAVLAQNVQLALTEFKTKEKKELTAAVLALEIVHSKYQLELPS
jgi:hypothetical protein